MRRLPQPSWANFPTVNVQVRTVKDTLSSGFWIMQGARRSRKITSVSRGKHRSLEVKNTSRGKQVPVGVLPEKHFEFNQE